MTNWTVGKSGLLLILHMTEIHDEYIRYKVLDFNGLIWNVYRCADEVFSDPECALKYFEQLREQLK